MKNTFLVLLAVFLLVGAGVVLAMPIDQDGDPLAYPVEIPTVEPYPIFTAAPTVTGTASLEDTPIPAAPKPESTRKPVLGEPPTVPNG